MTDDLPEQVTAQVRIIKPDGRVIVEQVQIVAEEEVV